MGCNGLAACEEGGVACGGDDWVPVWAEEEERGRWITLGESIARDNCCLSGREGDGYEVTSEENGVCAGSNQSSKLGKDGT
ncbi:hypothetical protein SLEP1_g48273 [Rubroshorea leprosula]|uniref:Uncharacterized protein n=1 Tax=Rubroshorea leprosula TaxID=152421 RepID=A0AAV5LU84_9ROSI|nr:hypothetical protein SLEP1_g48273 [Rubroshorea leprosula]